MHVGVQLAGRLHQPNARQRGLQHSAAIKQAQHRKVSAQHAQRGGTITHRCTPGSRRVQACPTHSASKHRPASQQHRRPQPTCTQAYEGSISRVEGEGAGCTTCTGCEWANRGSGGVEEPHGGLASWLARGIQWRGRRRHQPPAQPPLIAPVQGSTTTATSGSKKQIQLHLGAVLGHGAAATFRPPRRHPRPEAHHRVPHPHVAAGSGEGRFEHEAGQRRAGQG